MMDGMTIDSLRAGDGDALHVGRIFDPYAERARQETGNALAPVEEDAVGEGNGANAADREDAVHVDISLEARRLAAKNAEEDEDSGGIIEQTIERIKERIKELQEELKELESSPMPEEMKRAKKQQIQDEIAQLNEELAALMKDKNGSSTPGGTRAEGFSSSLT